jgi:hypothetical protein
MPFNKINLDADTNAKLQTFASLYNSLETALTLLGDGREKMLAITNLEQSYLWLVRCIEREQIEKTLNHIPNTKPTYQSPPTFPNIPIPPAKPLSSEATILAESRNKLDSLMDSIKNLTSTIAVKGLPKL